MILFNNFDLSIYYDDARELLTEDGENVTDEKIYTYAAEQANEDFSILYDDLKRYFDERGQILAVGSCGTWRGTFEGGAIYKDFKTAFYKIFKDCDYLKITDDGGRLLIEGAHHDGRNYAEFVTLTERGENLIDKWKYDYNDPRTEKEIHSILYRSNLFAKIPHFARDHYGAKEGRRKR